MRFRGISRMHRPCAPKQTLPSRSSLCKPIHVYAGKIVSCGSMRVERGMPTSKSQVLISDANAIVRRAVGCTLAADPRLTVCGENSDSAELFSDIEKLKPDLVVLDLPLREGEGFGLVTRLRRQFRDLRMLVFSTHSEALFAHRALRAGADGYLRKGCSEEDLLRAIHIVLNGSVYVSDSLQKSILQRMRGMPTDGELDEGVARLSNREAEVFELMMTGMRKRDMAKHLGISAKTIESHCAHIRRKLSFHDAQH